MTLNGKLEPDNDNVEYCEVCHNDIQDGEWRQSGYSSGQWRNICMDCTDDGWLVGIPMTVLTGNDSRPPIIYHEKTKKARRRHK